VARRKAPRRSRIDGTTHLKLRIVWIGKTRDAGLAKLAGHFEQLIGRFVPIEIAQLKDPRAGEDRRQLAREAERILAALDDSDRIIALDATGRMWSSAQFSEFVGAHLGNDPRRLTFVIGGYGGLADAVKHRAERTWSLSPLTFTHEMTRVLVLEQIYRAIAILRNLPYAK
jgi:23S rRNA (pseudouridine1915-N3)-methyltransferase